jgi:hypothetical protein
MFNLDDQVRLIPKTYASIFKGYNSPYNWDSTSLDTDGYVMLGGAYKILKINRLSNGVSYYSLLANPENGNGSIIEDDLILNGSVKNCSFKLGDKVVFALSDDEIKCQYFPVDHQSYNFRDKSTAYTVTEVLNNFYIFLDYKKGDTHSAPFRWDNFALKM